MIDNGKKNILGILVDTVDYEGALARILRSAKLRIPLCGAGCTRRDHGRAG